MPPEDWNGEHDGVFADAGLIYRKRSQVRGQMWLDTTVAREFEMVKEKVQRGEMAIRLFQEGAIDEETFLKEMEESCLDGMNFLNFALKKARRGKRS